MPEPEALEHLPVHSSRNSPVAAAEPSPRALRRQERAAAAAGGSSVATSEEATAPDPFLGRFHRVVKEMLPAGDFAVLEEMAKGDVGV